MRTCASSLCRTVFSECKAMDKSTNLLTTPFFTADHSSYANSTATVHKFHHCCIYTEFAVSYASTEFRIHYKLGVLRALHKMLFSKCQVQHRPFYVNTLKNSITWKHKHTQQINFAMTVFTERYRQDGSRYFKRTQPQQRNWMCMLLLRCILTL